MKNIITKGLLAGALVYTVASCSVTVPVTASNAEIGSLRGTSETVVLFGAIYLNKNYGIKEAAKKGKITSAIATMDEETKSYIIFQKKKLIVTAK